MIIKLKNYIIRVPQLNIILFKSLGVGGAAISFISFIAYFISGAYDDAVPNLAAGIVSILLLYYVEKTGRYLFGYVITLFSIFIFLFDYMFFIQGGYEGSMPYFFCFAIIFTFLMFQGKFLVFMECLLFINYTCAYLINYYYPGLVTPDLTGFSLVSEKLVGLFFASITMGLIFLLYIHAYMKQKKAAEEANEAKSLFLANMSHEIRTPVNAVLGFNDIILRSSNESSTLEYARSVDQSGHQLLEIINEILDFSRLEAQKEVLHPVIFNLQDMISVSSYMGVTAQSKHLDFEIEQDEKLETFLIGDVNKIQRVLDNLLSNAFKYTKEGKVILRLLLMESRDDVQKIRFEVEDTGIGIKKEDLSNLFCSYERVDWLKNQNIQGTGLGLAITKQLVELMGGAINVDSTYGVGSRFSFELSLPVSHTEKSAAAISAKSVSFIAPGARVLVADDNGLNRNLFHNYLSKLKIQADMAENGREVLDKYHQKEYDLIMMDYMMPELDGAEAMKLIRQEEEKTGKHTPIVVLTADVVDQIDQKLIQIGFDEYLSKPIRFDQISAMIMRRLPEKLIIWQEETIKVVATEEQIAFYDIHLKDAGIKIREGLIFTGNDLEHYLQIAGFFVQNSKQGISMLQQALMEEDPEALRLSFHSLKSNAGNIGAKKLQELAKDLEERCKEGDIDYVNCAAELLILQWKRCISALQKVLDTREDSKEVPQQELSDYSVEDLWEELERELALCQVKRAKEILRLIKQKLPTEDSGQKLLDDIGTLVDSMDFDLAMEILARDSVHRV